jgi:SAM-dependent methyltransferase
MVIVRSAALPPHTHTGKENLLVNNENTGTTETIPTHKPGRDGSWGAAARDWATYQEGTMSPIFKAVLERVDIGPGKAVLDVGCGTGLFCMMAIDTGATAAGLDASAGQLEVARERLPQADFRQGEMEDIPFADNQFDLISCCNALQYSMDPLSTLRQMKRVSKPGGSVSIISGTRTSTGTSGMGAVYANLMELREKTSAPGPKAPRIIFSDPDAITRFMGEAGLEVYDEQEVDCPWDYPDLESAFRGGMSFAPGVRIIQYAGRDAVYELVRQSLEPYKTSTGGYHIPNRARYVLGKNND